jgi:hypothetical protein
MKMKLTKKQEIETSLKLSMSKLIENGQTHCDYSELHYTFTKDGEEVTYELQQYSEFGSNNYNDKLANEFLKANGYVVKNNELQLPQFRKNKNIIKLIK